MHSKQGERKVKLVIVAADNRFSLVLFRLDSFGSGKLAVVFLAAYVIRSMIRTKAEPNRKSILTQRQRSANWAKDSRQIYRVAAIRCVANPLHRFVGPNVEPSAPRCLVVLTKWCTRRAAVSFVPTKGSKRVLTKQGRAGEWMRAKERYR